MRGGIENPSRGGHGQHAMGLFETMSLAQLGLVVWRVSVGCCFVLRTDYGILCMHRPLLGGLPMS